MATKKRSIRVKYILNPGDGKPVDVEVGILSTGLDDRWLAKAEHAHDVDAFAKLYRVLYAGRKLIFEEFDRNVKEWFQLEVDERIHVPNKVLEHIR